MTSGNILLVEDHEDNRNIYRTILEHYGFTVLLAGDGEEGIRLAAEGRPDLILLDIDIPVYAYPAVSRPAVRASMRPAMTATLRKVRRSMEDSAIHSSRSSPSMSWSKRASRSVAAFRLHTAMT